VRFSASDHWKHCKPERWLLSRTRANNTSCSRELISTVEQINDPGVCGADSPASSSSALRCRPVTAIKNGDTEANHVPICPSDVVTNSPRSRAEPERTTPVLPSSLQEEDSANETAYPDSPLRTQYWSTTPFKLGPLAVKFSARPDLAGAPILVTSPSRDKLRAAMSAHLRRREARFDFLVQLQTDPVAMPVEDPTVVWDEMASPYRKVATICIPSQSFESTEQMQFCENLSFTPWHALAEHRPLGGINRTRKKVYQALSQRRHELNGVPMQEPNT